MDELTRLQNENNELRAAIADLFAQCCCVHRYWGDHNNTKQADAAKAKARGLAGLAPD